ncbi:MAG: PDZ domain-containing protein [Thermodesulfovibrio sp.]|nr:PDZ domain-containing protein [Thermodesulfovibrio sp.]
MFTNKGHTKTLVFFLFSIVIFLFFPLVSFGSDDLEKIIRSKIEEINKNFLPALITLENGIAVLFSENIALAPSSIIDDDKKILAIDSKLKISLFKTEGLKRGIEFKNPDKNSTIFFLLSRNESFNILLVNGKVEDNLIKVEGKHVLGSLLISIDLKPLGIVVQNDDNISEALVIKDSEQEIMKLINRKSGWLGIQGQTVTEDLKKILFTNYGVIVTNVYEGGPAYKAGIKRGDIIIEVDTLPIKDIKDLQNLMSTKFSGENIQLKIMRNNSKIEINLILEDPPEIINNIKSVSSSIPGLEITEIPISIKQTLRNNIKGVFINRVMESSPALGILKNGDIIVEINKKEVNNTQEFYEMLSKSSGDLLILVYRQNNFQYVIIPLQKFR